jgi:hypothetical protein
MFTPFAEVGQIRASSFVQFNRRLTYLGLFHEFAYTRISAPLFEGDQCPRTPRFHGHRREVDFERASRFLSFELFVSRLTFGSRACPVPAPLV